MNEEAIKHAFDLFASDGYTGNYDQFKQLIQSNTEAKTHAFGLFASDGYTGSEVDFDQLIGGGASEPVKKKEESVPLWLQKQEQAKPKQEQTPPFLESKPSGISLGSQRVPETAPMFEAPPMRTAEEAQAIVEAPEKVPVKSQVFTGSDETFRMRTPEEIQAEGKPQLPEQKFLNNVVSAIDKAVYKGFIGMPIKALGTAIEGATGKGPISEPLIKFGDYFNNAIDELTPQDEEFKGTLTDQFAQAFGQVAAILLTEGLAGTGAATTSLAVNVAPKTIGGAIAAASKQLASSATRPGAISAGLSMGQSEFDRAKEAGATDEQAYEAFYKNAAVGSVLEQIPVMQFLKRFNQSTAGGVTNYIKTKGVAGLTGGLEEMTTEVLQQLYSNKTAQEIYNINQDLIEGVGESGGIGFGVGFLLNAMGAKAKALKKEGNTAEAQLIESQIENFESKPKGPTPSYSVNGIKIESPEVINQMIDKMDATDLANSNIEITNDPELSVKMQDKMVTSSIKEEVRSANPDIDEDTLDQITALEKERKKFEGKKTQSAKDKLASINSQIKTLQENAVQKPSTEESVLRAEESQVGLQEVGEGNAQVQAPTEEVVKEEVATTDEELQAVFDRIEIPEDTEVLPGVDDELKTINESIGRVKEPVSREKDDQILQNLDEKIARAKRRIATADDADVAIEEFKQAQKEKTDFEETINKKKNFSKVDGLISDEIYFRDRDKGQYEYQELFDQDPRLAALQSAKDMIEFANKNPDENINVEGRDNDIKILEEDIAKFPVKQAVLPAAPVVTAKPKVSSKTPKAKSVPIPVAIPKPTSPAPKPVAVEQSTVKEPTAIYASDGSLFQAYMKDEIGKAFRNLGFKKFANLFRKHVDPSFSRANNTKAVGGQVDKDFTFEELAGYIIGDGTYSITEDQYRSFAKEAGIDMPVPAPKPVAAEEKFKKLKTIKDIEEDPRVDSIYKQRDDEGVSWWIELKDGYEWAPNSQIIHEYTVNELLSIMNNDVQAVVKPTPVSVATTQPSTSVKESAPAPKPVAVVSQPTTKAVGPEALRQEYTNKINDVRVNKDKSRTPKQIEERIVELRAEYKKLNAEMTAPRPKAEPEAKPVPKKAAPIPKAAPKVEPVVSKKDQEEIKRLEDSIDYEQGQIEDAIEEIGNTKYNLKEALAEIKKKRDALKGQKMSADARAEAKEDLDAEIEQAKDEHDTYLEQYNDQLAEAKKEKRKAEAKLAKLQAKQVETKAEPTSVVEEEEPSYEDIKDLDPTDETNLKKMLRKFDSMDNGLGEFGRGNLSSGMAIPLARAILKSIKVLLRAGIKIEDAIKRLATQNNLEEKDIVNMIKDVDKAQSAMKKLKDQIKAEARSATNAKNDMNQKRKNLSKVISEIEASGKISAFKAQAVINKIGKLNLDSKVAVDKFIDYAGKIFADAEYANKLNTAKNTRSQIRKLSKSKENFANLRDLGSKFAAIDPSMVEDIDEYNEMATLIRDSIKGSTTRKADVKFANMIKESDAMDYINKAMEAQQKMLLSQKQAEVQELLDIDASDLTYDQLMELVDSDKPLTKDNEKLIRAAINKAFRVYSSIIKDSIRNNKDVFTDEEVKYSDSQKKTVREFMDMDLNMLKPKESLEAVDALINFLQNQSVAKMGAVYAKYKGETEMRAIEKKGIKAKPIRKYWSKGLGRLLLEQTANLPIVFERMFGGFTKGGMVEDAMGVTALKNGKSKAQSESNNIVNKYVDKFYKLKPNGEVFNTAFNNIERGLVAFMSRNVIGTDSEMKAEFKRRRDLIEESITELEKGNEQEVAKAKVYQEVYDKILKDSDSIEQVQGKAAPENLEAVKFWLEEWSDKYEQLSDTALGVYNKKLEKDINYTPDRYSKLSSDTGEIDITTEDMGFLVNSGTAPLYKKETGVLMAATRPESLPKSKGTSKTNRYIDLSFDNANSNAMYDALVDINTAAPIRQVQSALNSDAFARIMKGTGDEKLIKNRIDLYVRNIRNKNPFSNDEFSKAVKNLNRVASVGVGQALGGVLQPIKQVAPIAMNTLINAGGLDVRSTFDLAKQKFMDESGYAIGNRGVESQAQIESLNKMIEEAAKSKPEQAIKAIEKINNWWLKSFLVKPDVYIARASWMTYYEQSLKKQGVNTASIDYSTHEINETAANYAQRQVDRQQNVSDSDLAGALLSDKDASKQLFVKVLMPFASFRMNQSARLGSDLSTIMDKTATKEDKEIATRSLGGFAVEMAVFRAVSAASALLIAAVVKGVMGRDDDEEKEKKKNDAIVKGQLTSTVADVFSPTPLLDKAIQIGASAVLDATQDALDVSDEDRLEIYSGNKQDFFQSLGLLGISGARASQLYEMSMLAAGGSYEDNYGRKKYLSEKDRDAIATLIPIAIVSNIGLAPSEVNSIVRSSLADAKRSGTTVESEESKRKSEESKIMGLNKEDLKRYYPDIYEEYYGEGTPDAEQRKLDKEEADIERQMKDEYYNYTPKEESKSESNKKRSNTRTNKDNGGFGGKGFAD